MPVQDGQSRSVAEERVFGEQLGTVARQVRQGTGEGAGERRLGDAAEELMSRLGETIPEAFCKMDELIEHNWVYFSHVRLVALAGASLAQPNYVRITGGWVR